MPAYHATDIAKFRNKQDASFLRLLRLLLFFFQFQGWGWRREADVSAVRTYGLLSNHGQRKKKNDFFFFSITANQVQSSCKGQALWEMWGNFEKENSFI